MNRFEGLPNEQPSLFTMLIAGRAESGHDVEPVINPADQSIVGYAPVADVDLLEMAILAADEAFVEWSRLSWDERSAYLVRLADAIELEKTALAELLCLEQGKPFRTQAVAEIEVAVEFLRETSRLRLPPNVLRDTAQHTVEVHALPLGVVGAITPWNFPVQLAIWKLGPNLLAGNTVVLKPAPSCPLTVLRIGEIAGSIFPAGVLNIICGGSDLGAAITAHSGIAKISFTGSTATGTKVMVAGAVSLKRLVLELGGNDPAIVLPDADIQALVPVLFWGAFYNSGQNCVAIKRLYVHDAIYDEFLEALVNYASSVRLGDGMDEASALGPIQNRQQYERLIALTADSRANGHAFVLGGEIDQNAKGFFFPVTIVDNPPEDSRIVQEEQFGPILPILRYRSVDEAVRRANASPMGLAASVWGRDAERIGASLQAGTVWVNESHVFGADIPFCGHKQSGLGVELGLEGLTACTALQVRTVATMRSPG